MATETVKKEPRTRRVEDTGVIGSIWEQSGATIVNASAMGENFLGLGKDSLAIAREKLKPSHIDAKVETLSTFAEGIQDLLALGISEEEAKTYLATAM